MLNQLTLKKFRQFDNKIVDFGAGNIVLRGANEAGKSTIVEGLMYLMGGTKQCRNSDFLQWGAKPAQCQVEGLMTFNGRQIRATRGPRGAEIYVPADAKEPSVTGQTEVTEFFAEQIGTSLDVAAKMMFAGQKEIGGMLDEKNGKVIEFIEEMSGLDIVDWFISRVVSTGQTGPTGPMQEALTDAQTRLDSEGQTDFGSYISELESGMPSLQERQQAAAAAVENAQGDLRVRETALTAHKLAAGSLATARKTVGVEEQDLARIEQKAEQASKAHAAARGLDVIDADDSALEARRQPLLQRGELAKLHKQFLAYVEPEDVWEGVLDDLDSWIKEHEEAERGNAALKQGVQFEIAQAKKDAATARANVVEVGKKCRACGQMIPDAAGAEDHNQAELQRAADLEARIPALEAQLPALGAKIKEAQENAAAGRSIRSQRPLALAETHPHLIKLDTSVYPPIPTWKGGDVSDPSAELKEITDARAALRKERDDAQAAAHALHHAQEARLSAQARLQAAKASVEQCSAAPELLDDDTLAALFDQLEKLRGDVRVAEDEKERAAVALASARTTLESARANQAEQEKRVAAARAAVDGLAEKILAYEFNNELIAALRRARPVVANQLWNMILKGVSTYLSTMRGEVSIVERQDKTFLVNGKPYTSYSGSALDLLALGIRVGLAKVFVPGADMLILDEPFAACSAERTMQCLAFTAAAGFAQTVIITHENDTETVFDKVVEV